MAECSARWAGLTLTLGHLFLGHLGPDKKMKIPGRWPLPYEQQELEAESVAFLVCQRNGVASKSETYLSNHVSEGMTVKDIDIYQIMRAAGQVESFLGLAEHTKFDKPR